MADLLSSSTEIGIRGMEPEEGISFDGVIRLLRRHRVLVASCALFAAVTIVVIGLFKDRSYSSQAAFVLQAAKGSGGVSGLAAQFGVAIPIGDAAQSPQFYVDLLHSHQVLEPVAMSIYSVRMGAATVRGDLASFLHIADSDPALKRDKLIKALNRRVLGSVDAKTGVVTITVSAPNPSLAQQVAARLLDRLNVFNLEGRQSRASAERKFTEARLLEVSEQLHVAENQLEQFLETNRVIMSPQLRLEQDRLARAVAMRQQVYTSLAQSYEQAKIDEVRDLPVITVISEPEVPVLPDPRGLLKRGLMALIGGGAVGLALGMWLDRRRRALALA